MEPSLPSKEALQQAIQRILRQWHKPALPDSAALTGLRLYLHLVAKAENQPQTDSLLRQLVEAALQTLLSSNNKAAANLLRQRYLADIGIKELTRQLAISESQFYKLQDEALDQLAESIVAQERQLRLEQQLAVEARLEPLAHQKLFGVEQLRQRLTTMVAQPAKPWLIAIEGLGGIGKTSLADRLARELASTGRFYDLAWVSARQQAFSAAAGLRPATAAIEPPSLTIEALVDALLAQLDPERSLALTPPEKRLALTRLLKRQPYLVVIDNLETMTDYQTLIPMLHQLAGPSKFVLTSRHSLHAYADVFCLNVTELDRMEALALLTYEAQARELTALIEATPEQLTGIYEVTGGNPLALKLALGQIHALPLSQVLANLKQAQGRKITELYTYIYWQSWQTLNDSTRRALLALPVASPRGSTLAHLAAVSGLDAGELSQALEELIACSLVEVGGGLENRRYSIHRLTETFLLTEVTQWLSPH